MNSEWRPVVVLERIVKSIGNSGAVRVPRRYEGHSVIVIIKQDIPKCKYDL